MAVRRSRLLVMTDTARSRESRVQGDASELTIEPDPPVQLSIGGLAGASPYRHQHAEVRVQMQPVRQADAMIELTIECPCPGFEIVRRDMQPGSQRLAGQAHVKLGVGHCADRRRVTRKARMNDAKIEVDAGSEMLRVSAIELNGEGLNSVRC